MSRPAAWQEGYEWAYWPTHKVGKPVITMEALQSHGYAITSDDAAQFIAGANAALDEMEGRP